MALLTASYSGAVARSIAQIHLAEPPLDLTVRSEADLQRFTNGLAARRLPTGTLRLRHAGPIGGLPGYEEGAWWVQDAAATLPAKLLGDVRGQRVLDLCAAPGGKTAQLAATGAHVIAVDRSPKRIRRLEDNMRRLGLRAETVSADITTWRAALGTHRSRSPGRALLGYGDHPTPPGRHEAEDGNRDLGAGEATAAAARRGNGYARAGGDPRLLRLLAATRGGERLVDSSMADGLPLQRAPLGGDESRGLEQFLTSVGDLRTLPCHIADCGGLDGFYAAGLQRRSAQVHI